MSILEKQQERLARAVNKVNQKKAAVEAAEARLKLRQRRVNREVRNDEIKTVGKFARDTGLTALALLDPETFDAFLKAASDPAKCEEIRRWARGEGAPNVFATSKLAVAAE